MKILFLDIETAPADAWVWGLWQQNVGHQMVKKGFYVLCWSAKWYGQDTVLFDSIHKSGEKHMLERIHQLLDQADVVVHFYGTKFDIPMLNTEFVKHGMNPPSPYKQVDLKKVSRDNFRFPSNKLAYVSEALKVGHKIKKDVDFDLWTACMKGDNAAWKIMEEYNKMDTLLLERLYEKFRPWIKNHPNIGSYGKDHEVCPNCGSKHHHRRGYAIAQLKRYPRFQCQDCGKWFRGNVAVPNTKVSRYVSI